MSAHQQSLTFEQHVFVLCTWVPHLLMQEDAMQHVKQPLWEGVVV